MGGSQEGRGAGAPAPGEARLSAVKKVVKQKSLNKVVKRSLYRS